MDTKTCTKCGTEKPATREFFAHRDGARLRADCRSCQRSRSARYYIQHRKDIIARVKARYETHREEMSSYYRARYADHREEVLEYCRAYNAAHREEHYARSRAWVVAHRDESRAHARRYNATHPEQMATIQRNRRARLHGNGGSHTDADIRAQYEAQQGRCQWCGKAVGDDYHVDHVMPIKHHGSNGPENLVIACPTCNLRKNAKMPHEFIADAAPSA
jgi:5-methylcytosine-specific restriction endonuclease McrA